MPIMTTEYTEYSPSEAYYKLASEITESDHRKVLRVMAKHIGERNAISLRDLQLEVLGKVNDGNDRKIRIILEALVNDYRVPICAYSGKAGRWIAASADERNKALADLGSREQAMRRRADNLRRCKLPFDLAEEYRPRVEPVQNPLFELPKIPEWERWR